MYDFCQDPKKLQEKDPLWKGATILDDMQKNSQRCWLPGKWLAVDEQTIGFKGAHGLALCISYKRKGDGNQCDAVCKDGYTFLFYFHHGNVPTLPPKYNDLELSPTGRRVIFLMMQLPNIWSHIFMDNLFNSCKLFTAVYHAKAVCHGVVRSYGRGVPKAVIMKEEKNVKEADRLRNWTKAAVLRNAEDCPDLLCCSVYDTKPVHIMSTVAECIEWDEKDQKVWSSELGGHVSMKYLCLNLIDDYNIHMNSVDLADQLRNCYRFNHWFWNRKWWRALFLLAISNQLCSNKSIHHV